MVKDEGFACLCVAVNTAHIECYKYYLRFLTNQEAMGLMLDPDPMLYFLNHYSERIRSRAGARGDQYAFFVKSLLVRHKSMGFGAFGSTIVQMDFI